MLRFATHEIGILRGEAMIIADFDVEGPMWTAQGERQVRHSVTFTERFVAPPVVQLSLGMWDLDGGCNQRGDLQVRNVTLNGFDILFQTWGDTRIARMRVQWTAIGAVPDEQDFIL